MLQSLSYFVQILGDNFASYFSYNEMLATVLSLRFMAQIKVIMYYFVNLNH